MPLSVLRVIVMTRACSLFVGKPATAIIRTTSFASAAIVAIDFWSKLVDCCDFGSSRVDVKGIVTTNRTGKEIFLNRTRYSLVSKEICKRSQQMHIHVLNWDHLPFVFYLAVLIPERLHCTNLVTIVGSRASFLHSINPAPSPAQSNTSRLGYFIPIVIFALDLAWKI